MKPIEDSILLAMDGKDIEILPYLPYILQDFWEIGSNPEVMIDLIKKHHTDYHNLKVLDLGCGKGAVSINIARHLGCECYGIDAIPEFVSFCRSKSKEWGVEQLCSFEYGDIREIIRNNEKYDVIVLGAIGQVLGDYYETLTALSRNLKENGTIIYDDGYLDDQSNFTHEHVLRKSFMRMQIFEAGMQMIDEVVANGNEEVSIGYDDEFIHLKQRCEELCVQYPEKAEVFRDYVKNQHGEYEHLKNDIICSTMVIKRI